MPFAAVRGLRMYYEMQEPDPAPAQCLRLLYISGTGGDLRQKPNVFDSPLGAHFAVLAYDQRGLGQTDRPDIPYTMADYADDADALLDTLGWSSCLVMGVSFGGMVAQEFALRHPARVVRLVLACTSSGGAGGASFPLHDLEALSPEERAWRMVAIADSRNDAAWQTAHPEDAQALVQQRLAPSVGQDEPGREAGRRRQLEARQGHDTYARLPNLRRPVLVAGGVYDGLAPVANLRALQEKVPEARLELFEGGHGFLDQDPRAYPQVIRFLQGQGGE